MRPQYSGDSLHFAASRYSHRATSTQYTHKNSIAECVKFTNKVTFRRTSYTWVTRKISYCVKAY